MDEDGILDRVCACIKEGLVIRMLFGTRDSTHSTSYHNTLVPRVFLIHRRFQRFVASLIETVLSNGDIAIATARRPRTIDPRAATNTNVLANDATWFFRRAFLGSSPVLQPKSTVLTSSPTTLAVALLAPKQIQNLGLSTRFTVPNRLLRWSDGLYGRICCSFHDQRRSKCD